MKPEKTNHETEHSAATPGDFLVAQGNSGLANEHDRLQWLAFCYVADELTTSQRAEFESRLATDLQAQEALASAVELGGEIYRSYKSTDELPLLDRAATRNLPGLVQNNDQSTAHNNLHDQPSAVQLSILADDWIDSLDGDEIETADSGELSELTDWESDDFEQIVSSLDSGADKDLVVDTSLISFYSEMLDSGQEDSLLNSDSLRQKTRFEL